MTNLLRKRKSFAQGKCHQEIIYADASCSILTELGSIANINSVYRVADESGHRGRT